MHWMYFEYKTTGNVPFIIFFSSTFLCPLFLWSLLTVDRTSQNRSIYLGRPVSLIYWSIKNNIIPVKVSQKLNEPKLCLPHKWKSVFPTRKSFNALLLNSIRKIQDADFPYEVLCGQSALLVYKLIFLE